MTDSLQKSKKNILTASSLENLRKEELIEKVLQLDAHNTQLLNIIHKKHEEKTEINKSKKSMDFSKVHFRHILLKLYYLGWNYKGFAAQEDTTETIEHHLFSALIKTCLIKDRQSSNYHRCGRTDKGVSAFCQVISIDVRSKFPSTEQNTPENVSNELQYCKMLNRVLPKDIQCISWCPVPSDYSARFNCNQRTYKYFFPRGSLNIDAMLKAAQYLVGTHDFRNFCKMDVANGVTEYVRNIKNVEIDRFSKPESVESPYDIFVLTINGKAFLWHQIRCIMAVLILVGQGKEEPDVVQKLLDIKTISKKPQYNMANEIPLNLFYCEYPEYENWIVDKEALQQSIISLQQLWVENEIKASMIRAMLNNLKSTIDVEIKHQDDFLISGARSKNYQPLLKRQTCQSLEDRVEHFSKKRKIEKALIDDS